MRILDYTADVRDLVITARTALDRLLPHFQSPQADPSAYLDDAARDLVALLTEIYQLRRFARLGAPHIDDLDGFGTGLDDADAPTVMSSVEGRESWDFQPWLAEKLQTAEQLLFRVCDICSLGSDRARQPEWRRLPQYENLGAECCRLLTGVQAYLKAMLELLDSGELKIRQLSAEDEFDDEDHG